MEPDAPPVVDARRLRSRLAAAGLRPSRRLGQNFLIDAAVLARIVEIAEAGPGDVVLEVGPGPGGLTRALAERARRVVAIERDRRFEPILAETLAGLTNVDVHWGDALACDWSCLVPPGSLFVANVPYGITSPLLLRVVDGEVRFRRAVVMVQREVADRLRAEPGTKAYGALTVAVRLHAEVRLALKVPRHCFWPAPDVDSAVVVLEPSARELPAPADRVASVARAAFGGRRKTLANALSQGLNADRTTVERALLRAGIDPARRGETLSVADFAVVARALLDAGVAIEPRV